VCDLLCVCQGSCVYVTEVVFMSRKWGVCEGSGVYVRKVVCMSGNFRVCQVSCV